jgi:hypothetical protein
MLHGWAMFLKFWNIERKIFSCLRGVDWLLLSIVDLQDFHR